MSSVLDVPAVASYEMRCRALVGRGVALWDVLQSCERSTSLDSDIVDSSIIPNDFATFLSQHTGVRTIFFNGAKAEKTYLRNVYPELPERFAGIRLVRLPSTSPANASIPFDVKLQHWQVVGLDG